MTLYEKISKYENSGYTALYYENKKISYKTLMRNIRKLANYLSERNIKKGDVVTLVLPNIPLTIYAFYALNLIGAIQNIVHPLTSFDKILETMEETNSKAVILLATNYEENEGKIKSSKYNFFFANPMHENSIIMKKAFFFKYKKPIEKENIHLIDKFSKEKEINNISSHLNSETSIYLHSGGTTGIPKVICLSDRSLNNLVSKIDNIVYKSIEGKSMLAVLPTFHGFGLGMGVHAPLANGASSSLMMKFNVKKVVKWINQNKINMIIGVPLLYQKLLKSELFLKSKLKNLEFCFVGGDNVPQSLIKEFNKIVNEKGSEAVLLEGYGLTETVTVCTVNTKKDFKLGSVGKPLKDLCVRILNDEMIDTNPNEIGEVYIKGDTLMNGYLNDETTTNLTMVNIGNETYIKSGDLGYLDEDGFIFLKGRKKRMFKISGINVYPSEIEKISTDNEDVIDASLEFFSEPNPHLILFLIKNKNSLKTNETIKTEIYTLLKQKFLKYSWPSEIIFLDEFPKTNVGKINHQGFIDPLKK